MSALTVQIEPWATFWLDAAPLAAAHSIEVDTGVESRRKFKVDTEMMAMMNLAGSLIIITARLDHKLVGYFTWTIAPDVESLGLLIALQGAWYVSPGSPRAAYAMFDHSIQALRTRGIRCIFPHHRLQGRGQGLGKFFHRRGAKLIQHTYCLWIGEEQANA